MAWRRGNRGRLQPDMGSSAAGWGGPRLLMPPQQCPGNLRGHTWVVLAVVAYIQQRHGGPRADWQGWYAPGHSASAKTVQRSMLDGPTPEGGCCRRAAWHPRGPCCLALHPGQAGKMRFAPSGGKPGGLGRRVLARGEAEEFGPPPGLDRKAWVAAGHRSASGGAQSSVLCRSWVFTFAETCGRRCLSRRFGCLWCG